MATGDSKSASVKLKHDPTLVTIKTEPGLRTHIKTERLSSFKMPRDLTLGGPGPGKTARGGSNKKIYTPNLNAVRHKNTDVKTSRDTQHKKMTKSPQRERGGKVAMNRGNLVQTMGVFSEGTAKSAKRHSESRYSSSERESLSLSRRSSASKKDTTQPVHGGRVIRDILDSSDEDDCTMDEDATMPVMLQAADRIVLSKDVVKEVKVKVEPPDETISNAPTVSTTIPFNTKLKSDPDGAKTPQSLEEIFGSKSSQLFLLQLPDTLPGTVLDTSKADSRKEGDDQDTSNTTSPMNSLKQQDEGLVGKFVRYKSGKTKLVLGTSQFDLDVGIDTDFLQQLVSIDANPEQRSGNMYNLGKIQTKLTATPDWEHMFRNMI
ncbi:DNA-directed RNA polymerase III subunit RPC4 isoform X1 [Phlebotomus papatasi]|uniref:DNA-directed RNA polymerase III subunit RPC4 isoform X1 n=1 Tax=Phlebotomus papatasi TaxID=29031 RepID=UPI0024847145|nr:DNA-directed RNA polymerase III subunit RPC4 isoform X1 [Phlebotomus papatasi]